MKDLIGNLFFYVVGAFILGMILTELTLTVLEFVPFFFAGLVFSMPIYGAVKQKGYLKHAVPVKKSFQFMKNSYRTNWKRNVTIYLVVGFIVINTYTQLVEQGITTLVFCMVSALISFAIWESSRFIARKMKKVSFISYGEAIKCAIL